MSIRIVLADDHQIVLAGIRSLLEKNLGLQVVAEAGDGLEALKAVAEQRPDIVVMDVSMPGMNGIEATRQIRAGWPKVKILCLSMHAERQFISAALAAGASGYLLKDCALEELERAIRTVIAGHTYLSPAIADTVVADYRTQLAGGALADPSPLSEREREVLQLLAEGASTKTIAARLVLSAKTVASHREHIMAKLGVHSVAELTKYAIRHGLTTNARQPRDPS
jgi:two-component system response regulator NreC